MMIGTIKSTKQTPKGAWAVTMQDKTSLLCFKGMEFFNQGDKIEYDVVKKTSAIGNDWLLMENPRKAEEVVTFRETLPNGRSAPIETPKKTQWETGEAQMDIFVTGVVGRAMGSGKFEANEIHLLTQAAAEAWRSLHGK